ncbi:hypothetical protein SAMN04489713_102412 [Actinomadura madurae]|uniref:Uncharacterized protein n=1 Tax=Actinomadura madurae TaxID=1993 RepID=A0A1I5A1L9_9ACTN|nr:hypothetical protein SAMN04489713_102412 [Actinomadura madurae]SPT56901.1 Uncharacterised protein [Actinomadura madurae]
MRGAGPCVRVGAMFRMRFRRLPVYTVTATTTGCSAVERAAA